MKIRIINYPTDLTASHELIDALVKQLNDYRDQMKHTKKDVQGQMLFAYSQPHGVNGDCQGAVAFMNNGVFAVPLQHDSVFQPIKHPIEPQ